MKLAISKSALIKIIKLLKWGKITAKLALIGTTVTGAATALSGSTTTGIALSAGGATVYAATKGMPAPRYEKTKHIPPGRVDKTANLLRKLEMEHSPRGKGVLGKPPGMRGPTKPPGIGTLRKK